MGERIDQFCENLPIKLKAKIESKPQTAEEVRTQLETVKKRIERDRTKLETAQADVKKWVDIQGGRQRKNRRAERQTRKSQVAEPCGERRMLRGSCGRIDHTRGSAEGTRRRRIATLKRGTPRAGRGGQALLRRRPQKVRD
jgi:hypothetical protein